MAGKISIRTRTTEQEVNEMEKDIGKMVSSVGGNMEVKKTRMCDSCNNPIKKGERYKGEGMDEFCEECSISKKVEGDWKINPY